MEKVLLISVDFPPHKDGVSSVSEALARKLVAEGNRLWVIGPRSSGDRAYDRRQPFGVLRSPGYDWGYLRFLPLGICFLYALWKLRPHQIFAMNIAYGGVLSYFFRFLGYRYYLWAYGYEFHKVQKSARLRRLYLKMYGACESVFVISHFVADRLADFGVPRDKMQLVYPAVDPQKFRPLQNSGTQSRFKKPNRVMSPNFERVILSVSRLVERKGQDQVLRALPTLLQRVPDARYWIAGEGPMRGAWEMLARELGVSDQVRFLGRVGDQELVRLYNQCDVFVMPSRECEESGHVEGFGIVFLEANACGKPVIGGRSGGMPEAIEEGKTGFLVNPDDIADLTAKLECLLLDKKLAQEMGDYGRQRVVDSFNWDKTLQRVAWYPLRSDSSGTSGTHRNSCDSGHAGPSANIKRDTEERFVTEAVNGFEAVAGNSEDPRRKNFRWVRSGDGRSEGDTKPGPADLNPNRRVVLLTRTSRPSGAIMAEALLAGGIGLVGIVAERRLRLVKGRQGIWKTLKSALAQHGLEFVCKKVWEQLRMTMSGSWRLSVEAWAAKRNMPLFIVDDHNGLEGRKCIENLNPDILVICNTRKLKPETFAIARKAALNLHLSLLPRYAGLDSIFWALYHREREVGYSIHLVTEALDAGILLYQERIALARLYGEDFLYQRLIRSGCQAMARVVLHFEDFTRNAVPQNPLYKYFSWPSAQQRASYRRYRNQLFSDRPLKTLHIITRMVRGGAQENTLATAIGLRDRGYDVVLATGPSKGPEGSMQGDIAASSVPGKRWDCLVRPVSFWRDLLTLGQLVRWIRKEKFLIVHTHTSKAGVLGRLAAVLARVPILVHTPHGHVFDGYFHPALTRVIVRIERMLARKTDKLIALTDAEKEDHLQMGIGTKDQFVTIPSGVRMGDFNGSDDLGYGIRKELGISLESPVVGTVARLVPVKGVEYLLDAVRLISAAHPDITCLIVGDGPQREELQKLAREYGIAERTVFTGYRKDVAGILAAMDVFVMASLNEGMGRAIVQAGLMRRAIVASAVSGIRNLIEHERNGLLVNSKDAEALAAAIERLLNDPHLRRRMGEVARERFEKEFSEEGMIQAIDDLYVDLAAKKGIPECWFKGPSLRGVPKVFGTTKQSRGDQRDCFATLAMTSRRENP